jgi:isopentenyl diphosphate isomerase/L-lactate dehydrogenase-like FMN-dependent dehydrogenase
LPRAIFDFVDGGAGYERTLEANESAFRRYVFRPRVLTDVTGVDIGTTVLGRPVGLPVFLGPSGAQRLVHPEGELAAARAAARSRTVYVLSVGSTRSIEEVADAGRGAILWFQLYLWEDHDWALQLIERARSAGYEALCVTVDIKAPGGRKYRDIRNGIARMPEGLGPGVLLDGARHVRWLSGYIRGWPLRTAHISTDARKGGSIFRASKETWRRMDPSATWDEIRWLRRVWNGGLIVKGILTAEDAELAYQTGADAVICSNHGGRALDGSPASLHVLPRVADVARRYSKEVYLDGGVRTGGDVVTAIALGADACLIVRPFWWGLTVAGERGVASVLGLFADELASTLTLLGRRRIEELDASCIEDLWEAEGNRSTGVRG